MSVSKWRWTPECDRGICVGDCDLCDKAKPEFGEWILCSDRLPEVSFSYSSDEGYACYDSERVLVTTEDGDVQIAYFSKEVVTDQEVWDEICGGEPEDVWFARLGDMADEVSVIAWMPLPEPYGGDK